MGTDRDGEDFLTTDGHGWEGSRRFPWGCRPRQRELSSVFKRPSQSIAPSDKTKSDSSPSPIRAHPCNPWSRSSVENVRWGTGAHSKADHQEPNPTLLRPPSVPIRAIRGQDPPWKTFVEERALIQKP